MKYFRLLAACFVSWRKVWNDSWEFLFPKLLVLSSNVFCNEWDSNDIVFYICNMEHLFKGFK